MTIWLPASEVPQKTQRALFHVLGISELNMHDNIPVLSLYVKQNSLSKPANFDAQNLLVGVREQKSWYFQSQQKKFNHGNVIKALQ